MSSFTVCVILWLEIMLSRSNFIYVGAIPSADGEEQIDTAVYLNPTIEDLIPHNSHIRRRRVMSKRWKHPKEPHGLR
jgi:hypothetical protein